MKPELKIVFEYAFGLTLIYAAYRGMRVAGTDRPNLASWSELYACLGR